MRQPKSVLHARALEYGMANLAHDLNISGTTLNRWVNVDHVPASRIKALSETLDVPLHKLMHLVETPVATPTTPTQAKPPGTLAVLLEVHRGTLSLEDAAERLQTAFLPLKKAYELNAHRLPLLYNTVEAYKAGRIKRGEAMAVLGVSAAQFHYLLRTYGETPRRTRKRQAPGKYIRNRPLYEKTALDVVAGRVNARKAVEGTSLALRTLHRYVTLLIGPRTLSEMTHWPTSFRAAWALELDGKAPKVVPNLVSHLENHGFTLVKRVKQPKPTLDFRKTNVQTLLRVVLYGEKTVVEVAAARGGSATVMKNLFNGVLSTWGLRFSQVEALGATHQAAIADAIGIVERAL